MHLAAGVAADDVDGTQQRKEECLPECDVELFVRLRLHILQINMILAMIVLHHRLDRLDTSTWVHLILLMGQPRQYLDKVDIIFLQIYNIKFGLVDLLDVQEGLLLDHRILLLVKCLTDDRQYNTPAGL